MRSDIKAKKFKKIIESKMTEERPKKSASTSDGENNKAVELEKYWQVVRDNPSDFAGWTYLLHFIEQENNIEAAREAFYSFFRHYPYCYGYWKKFADMEKNHNSPEAAEKIFEEGTKAIPLSVDLWIHYINFYKDQQAGKEDAYENIKSLFKRALDASGREFRSDRLWDLYVGWEEENKKLKEVTIAYDLLFTIPTQLYSHHFEKFRKHVKKHSPREILHIDEFLELRQIVVKEMKTTADGLEEEDEAKTTEKEEKEGESEAAPPGMEIDAPPGLETDKDTIDKELMSSEEVELVKKKIVEKRKALHEKNEIEVGKRWTYEEAIKRPYFHVKPLERAQLKNWKDYLDFEIDNGTHESTVILFERAMIACALYEDMWMKYAKYMEEQKPDAASQVYDRACKIHLPKKPSIHFSWAVFEEKEGRIDVAAKILDDLDQNVQGMLEITVRKINLERRQGNNTKVCELYEKCISEAKNSQMCAHFATKYARYLCKVMQDYSKAQEVLKEAVKNDPSNAYLLLQIIDLGYQREPMDMDTILEAFSMALASDMNSEQKLMFTQRKLEFLEDFSSDPLVIHEAFEEYAKTYKLHIASRKRAAEEIEAKEKKAKTEVNGIPAETASTTTAPVATHDATAYQYQQTWPGYAQSYTGYQQWPYAANYYQQSH